MRHQGTPIPSATEIAHRGADGPKWLRRSRNPSLLARCSGVRVAQPKSFEPHFNALRICSSVLVDPNELNHHFSCVRLSRGVVSPPCFECLENSRLVRKKIFVTLEGEA